MSRNSYCMWCEVFFFFLIRCFFNTGSTVKANNVFLVNCVLLNSDELERTSLTVPEKLFLRTKAC